LLQITAVALHGTGSRGQLPPLNFILSEHFLHVIKIFIEKKQNLVLKSSILREFNLGAKLKY